MGYKEKLIEKGKKIYQRFVDNVGKKNYERRLKENPEEYDIGYNSPKKIKQLIKQAEENKANVYKGYTIPMKYKNKTLNEYLKNNVKDKNINSNETNGVTAPRNKQFITSNKQKFLGVPIIRLLKPSIDEPIAASRYTLGHEIGHSKYIYIYI